MMTLTDDKIEAKFGGLESEALGIMADGGWDPNDAYEWQRSPSPVDYKRWRTEAMNLIERVCGRNSAHFQAIKRIAESEQSSFNPNYLPHCLGILQAAHRDYSAGFLAEIRYLVRAELLDDFLTQAELLLSQGYHTPAASLTGAVLEDTLRKLCDKHSVPYATAKTSIEALNMELARAEVYDKLTQKEITAKADLRNNANHGHFDKVRPPDVEDMLRWVRRFATERLR